MAPRILTSECCGSPAFCDRADCVEHREYVEACGWWDSLSPSERLREHDLIAPHEPEAAGPREPRVSD